MADIPKSISGEVGIEALEALATGMTIGLTGFWRADNIQRMDFALCTPGHPSGQHICPHVALLAWIAEILGVTPGEFDSFEHFCGVFRSNVMAGDMHGRRQQLAGHQDLPFRTCDALGFMLGRCRDLTVRALSAEIPRAVLIEPSASADEISEAEGRIQMIKQYQLCLALLDFFRSQNQPVFQKGDQVPAVLDNLLKSLMEQVLGHGRDMSGGFFAPPPEHCPVAPKHAHNQWLHID